MAQLKRDAEEFIIKDQKVDNHLFTKKFTKAVSKNKKLFCELQVEKNEKRKLNKKVNELEGKIEQLNKSNSREVV